MKNLTLSDIENAEFKLFNGNPIIKPFGGSFTVADPSLLTPDESQDRLWHLFCHTFFGVYRFDSEDGINFKKVQKVTSRAMRPNINLVDGRYYLFFERTRTLLGNALTLLGAKWKSGIYCASSVDLFSFTNPYPVIERSHGYEQNDLGTSISNPFLIKMNGLYRLYYSAGLTFIKDCGFSEPTHISYALSEHVDKDYSTRPTPIISPDESVNYLNLCAGCLKVYELKDCFIGIQNGIYLENGKSHSAIMLLKSDDGERFEFVKPLVMPDPNISWMAQYVYASHLTYYDGKLRLYFNARDVSNPLKGRECIGFCQATLK